jgi:hypothetical protein
MMIDFWDQVLSDGTEPYANYRVLLENCLRGGYYRKGAGSSP